MTGRGARPVTAVVVGVDASAAARNAVSWAAREAAIRALPLVVSHAYALDAGQRDLDLARVARERAWRRADEGVAAALTAVPGLEASAWAAPGALAQVLDAAVEDPALFVVAARGRGVLLSLLRRSSEEETRSGTRPVVFVRRPATVSRPGPDPQVVWGIADPSGAGWPGGGRDGAGAPRGARWDAAARFAFHAARLRDARLVVVPVPRSGSGAPDIEGVRAALAPHRATWPDVDVVVVPGDGTVAGPLRMVRQPDLLVIGSGETGGLGAVLGGALGCLAVNRARCPVVLVPEAQDPPASRTVARGEPDPAAVPAG